MIKTLLRKQLTEIFKSYFFDMKKNKARSKTSTLLYFALFIFIMVFSLGGMFGVLSYVLSPIISLGFGWLYYAILSLLAAFLGVFGGVFSTYSGLYLAKDNDLLLSMPVPVRAIMVSRIIGVYLMGLMYSAVVIIPAIIVYFITAPASVENVLGAVLLPVVISLFVLALSCIFGYFVAKISLKLKNKSFVIVLLSLAFFALYYFAYFKATTFINEFVTNVAIYGGDIKERAYAVYIIGKAGEGEILPLLAVLSVVVVCFALTLYVISRSFIKIATSSAAVKKARYRQNGSVKIRSTFGAVMFKELKRFTSSPNYMLNCGLGVVFMFAFGIFMLVKGGSIRNSLNVQFPEFDGIVCIIVCAVICMIASMNDVAAPSVALEGKRLWQIRSLPVPTRLVLKSKLALQIHINMLPSLFCVGCVIAALRPGVLISLLMIALTAAYVIFHALFSLYCGLHKPNLNWTNEVVPIKQGLNVMFAIFGGWGYAIAVGALYFLVGKFTGIEFYMLIFVLVTTVLSVLIYRWINNKGVEIFESL